MKEQTPLDLEIEHVLALMQRIAPDTDRYKMAAESLKLLHEARAIKTPHAIAYDTILYAATNLVGILLILSYEQLHPLTSKAIGFIKR